MIAAIIVYGIALVWLSIYGINCLILTALYLRHRHDPPPEPPAPDQWPPVTVQLPVYNELHTVERLLTCVGELDYPRDRLEIQVLDDSTDETREIVAQAVERLQQGGLDAAHITRPDRRGYKAGALAAGMQQAKGELLAVFDADFLPPSDFLRRVVPFFSDPKVGFVQCRWGHVNRDYSTLTRAQALGMDGHFVVEQTARSRAGLFINFNGTAGVWRCECIEDAGGWTGDTLTEDLDLSYRAQLRGWRVAYLPDVIVPAELPPQISAFKRQQARWAQGSIETAIKLIGPLLRSKRPLGVKLEGMIHLTAYMVHPLMLAVIILAIPVSYSQSWILSIGPVFMVGGFGPPLMYAVTQITTADNWVRRVIYLPLLLMLGIGIALSNAGAVLRAVFGVKREFQRTPKFDIRNSTQTWVGSLYAVKGHWLVWGELVMAAALVAALFLPGLHWTFMPWIALYAASFAYVGLLDLFQSLQRRRFHTRRRVRPGEANA